MSTTLASTTALLERERTAARSNGGPSPSATRPVHGAVLELQRLAGNRAVASLMGEPVVQRQHRAPAPQPVPSLPDANAAAANPFVPVHARMTDNPNVAPVVFPYREAMLRRFVAWHRDVEMGQLTGDAQTSAISQALERIRQERDRLAALDAPSPADRREKTRLDGQLARAERSAANALSVAQGWVHGHGGDELTGPALEAEVRRLGTALRLPDWETTTILDYGGMRYGRSHAESGGAPTAHGSYFAPQRLLWAIQTVRTGSVSPADANALMALTESEALGRLRAMRDAHAIPDRFWRLITYRTDLRLDTTDTAWNDVNSAAPAPTTDAERADTATWQRIMGLWTSDTAIRGVTAGPASVVGSTGWRNEMYRRRGVVALGVVCNELSEAIANQRGINLRGGITQNAQQFATDDARRTMGTAAGGRYFGPVDDEHLVPGANLFFLKPNWSRQGHAWDNVLAVSGVTYPQRLDPGATGTAPTDPLPPSPDPDGWTYHTDDGSAVTRSKEPVAAPEGASGAAGAGVQPDAVTPAVQGPVERQWMTWMHQATVAEIRGGSVWTLETTGTPEHGGAGAGLSERSATSLKRAGVYLGVDAAAHPAPAPAPEQPVQPAQPVAPGTPVAGGEGSGGEAGAAGAGGGTSDAPAVSEGQVQHAAETGRGVSE